MSRIRNLVLDGVTVAAGLAALVVGAKALIGPAGLPDDFEMKALKDWDAVVSEGRRLGPSDAVMTIVEWGDYECPACIGYQGPLSTFLADHSDEVALVYRHWPLERHRFAYDAARAAECAAKDGLFPEMHEMLYESGSLDRLSLIRLGEAIGVPDTAAYRTCIEDDDPVERIEADIAAIRELGGTGTPSIAINGILFGSPPQSDELTRMLDDLKKSEGGGE